MIDQKQSHKRERRKDGRQRERKKQKGSFPNVFRNVWIFVPESQSFTPWLEVHLQEEQGLQQNVVVAPGSSAQGEICTFPSSSCILGWGCFSFSIFHPLIDSQFPLPHCLCVLISDTRLCPTPFLSTPGTGVIHLFLAKPLWGALISHCPHCLQYPHCSPSY